MRTNLMRRKLRSEIENLQRGQAMWSMRADKSTNNKEKIEFLNRVDALEEQVQAAIDSEESLERLEGLQHKTVLE